MKVRGEVIFAFGILLLFAVALYICKDWSVKARLFPLLIVVSGVIISVLSLISEIRGSRHQEKKEVAPKENDPRAALKLEKQKTTPRSEGIMILWVLIFFSVILVFGFWVSIVVFTILFMRVFGRESWKVVAVYTASIWLLVYVTFSVGMKVSLFGGFLGLSW